MSSLPAFTQSQIGGRAKEIHALCAELDSLCADIRNVEAQAVIYSMPCRAE
jgi:hypothetical protein